MKRILSLLFLLLSLSSIQAETQPQYTRQDSIKVMQLLTKAKTMKPTTNWMIYFARQLRGIPYVAQTLEKNKKERLVINLRQLDCTTYVENVAALSLCMKNKKYTFEDFCDYLRQLRYEDGKVDYPTRLHYFTAWADNNEKMGFVEEEIQKPNPPFSRVQTININYMTQHADSYPMLKANPSWVKDIKKMEQKYNGQKFRYIPKEKIANTKLFRETIHDGDVIAIITKKKGLDTSHLGIAVWHKNGLHLLNASMVRHKVVEEPWTLRYYMSRHPSQIGIRVIRMK
ncbi:MAG: N-acetylmuramoyl-L-alanine amidase-like domain-containing protein [Prevotella sp.]|jgi:hypothetical protein